MRGFFQQVYGILARVPKGKVVTYGQIAAFLGHPRAARTVGWAMHSTPAGLSLPAHRVVNASGAMSPDHIFGPGVQRARLEREGVTFDKSGCIDMEKHQWSITVR